MPRPPFRIRDFVGQRRALAPVLREQDGALARGEPMPHMLFKGLSGVGKSLCAKALSERAGTKIVKFVGKTSREEIVQGLARLEASDIAFLDEAHNLDHAAQELLYEVIDAGVVPAALAPGPPGDGPVTIAPVTLIFATDNPGRLLNALLKRIPTTVTFRLYPEGELKEIVKLVAKRMKLLLSPQAARRLARVCSGLPRRAEHHVQKLRLYFADSEKCQVGVSRVDEFLRANGYDEIGLNEEERRTLRFLGKNGSASLDALAGYLGTDPDYVRQQVEQPLRYRGLVAVKSTGRVLTAEGKKCLRVLRQARKKPKEPLS